MVHPSHRYSDEYYLAVGKLTQGLAIAETEMAATIHVILYLRGVRKTKTGIHIASAVTGGMRFDALKETIKRLLKIIRINSETRLFVDKLFAHASEIQWLRNRLHHNHTEEMPGDGYSFVNSDVESVRDIDKTHAFGFTLQMITDAAEDILEICDALSVVLEIIQRIAGAKLPPLPTWRYKPSSLVRGGH